MTTSTKPPYWSFLICSHQNGAIVNAYFNGLPIGVITNGVFNPAKVTVPGLPNGRAITMQDLMDPCPFETIEDMKINLWAIIANLTITAPVKVSTNKATT